MIFRLLSIINCWLPIRKILSIKFRWISINLEHTDCELKRIVSNRWIDIIQNNYRVKVNGFDDKLISFYFQLLDSMFVKYDIIKK